jgi:hypothetical protein
LQKSIFSLANKNPYSLGSYSGNDIVMFSCGKCFWLSGSSAPSILKKLKIIVSSFKKL